MYTHLTAHSALSLQEAPNGLLRYPLIDGTSQRCFAGINFKPRKTLENAQIPNDVRYRHDETLCIHWEVFL